MKRPIKYLFFMVIWIIGYAFVKNLLPTTITHSWIMVVGCITGIIGFTFADSITNRFIGN